MNENELAEVTKIIEDLTETQKEIIGFLIRNLDCIDAMCNNTTLEELELLETMKIVENEPIWLAMIKYCRWRLSKE